MASQNTAKGQKYILQLDDEINVAAHAKIPEQSRTDVTDELTRKERLKNDDAEQNIRLKRVVLNRLFWFLGVETALIFTFTFLQATSWFGFSLPEWSFNILITATIAQIAGMLFVAVRYLFPTKGEK
jgi:hypothetical protein